jgi:hypothetical protein
LRSGVEESICNQKGGIDKRLEKIEWHNEEGNL